MSSPAIGYDGTIYFGCSDYKLYALNPNGQLKWSFPTGFSINSAPAIGVDATIYFGSGDTNFYALNPDGTKKWQYRVPDRIYGSPAIAQDGTIYFGSTEGKLYALYPDGTKRWHFAFDLNFGNSSSPAVAQDGTIYIGTYGGLYAVAPEGQKLWKYEMGDNYVDCAPAIDTNGIVYFSGGNGGANYLYSLYSTGSLKWSFPLGGGGLVQSSPAIDSSGKIYVTKNATLFSINPDGSQNWALKANPSDSCAPAVCQDGSILVGGPSGLSCVTSSGSTKWHFASSGQLVRMGPAVAADGTIYFCDYAGKAYALAGGQPLASTPWPMFHKAPHPPSTLQSPVNWTSHLRPSARQPNSHTQF